MSLAHQDTLWQLLGTLTVLLTVLASGLRTRQAAKEAHRERMQQNTSTNEKLDAVADTVNGKAAAMQARIDQLTEALVAGGIDVPPPKEEEAK